MQTAPLAAPRGFAHKQRLAPLHRCRRSRRPHRACRQRRHLLSHYPARHRSKRLLRSGRHPTRHHQTRMHPTTQRRRSPPMGRRPSRPSGSRRCRHSPPSSRHCLLTTPRWHPSPQAIHLTPWSILKPVPTTKRPARNTRGSSSSVLRPRVSPSPSSELRSVPARVWASERSSSTSRGIDQLADLELRRVGIGVLKEPTPRP